MNLKQLQREFVATYKPHRGKVFYNKLKRRFDVVADSRLIGAAEHCRVINLRWEAYIRGHSAQFDGYAIIPIEVLKEAFWLIPDDREDIKREFQRAIGHANHQIVEGPPHDC